MYYCSGIRGTRKFPRVQSVFITRVVTFGECLRMQHEAKWDGYQMKLNTET